MENQLHRLDCAVAGQRRVRYCPPNVPQGQSGPRLMALVAQLPTQEQLCIDETATKEANGKAWFWTFVAWMFTVFAVRATRVATTLGDFLAEKSHGVITCDRAKTYGQAGRLQWCWAHLKRDCRQ